MSNAVSANALCQCSFGTVPCPLTISRQGKVKTNKVLNIANVGDKNVATFGMCSAPTNPAVASANGAPQPCTPGLLLNWLPGSLTVRVDGKPLLTNDCRIFCKYAGLVTIQNGVPTINAK